MTKVLKKTKLRHNEYYDMQSDFDQLYSRSVNGENFYDLFDLIRDERNIMLAYRSIKANKGSNTPGVDKADISVIAESNLDQFVEIIQSKLDNYHPKAVRRVEIPKKNGKTRPLGIPTIEDRIVQQCIKQVLEPVCEAKFYEHSYGFRPNRSVKHALSRAVSLVNINKLYYAVNIDIKDFFDNVDHGKLLKQMWTLGIKDKRLLKIISKILKSEIKGIGIPLAGTPQGGIISPLLSNIVLNELDWWIASQFHRFPSRHEYSNDRKRFRALKDTSLKEMFIVRYADDFKIFCRTYDQAKRTFSSVTDWLKKRLGLDISEDKSKITNLRRSSTEFLGFEIKAIKKRTTRGEYVAKTKIASSNLSKMESRIRELTDEIIANPSPKTIQKYNSTILGWHNFYKYGTHMYHDFVRIDYRTRRFRIGRMRETATWGIGKKNEVTFKKLFGKFKQRHLKVMDFTLFPINGITHANPMNFTQQICDYTVEGRLHKHKNLKPNTTKMITYLMRLAERDKSTELNDNRISVFTMQNGKCAVTGELLTPTNMQLHHKTPKSNGGTDEFKNLVYVLSSVHKLIHATDPDVIEKHLTLLRLTAEKLTKVNEFRVKVGNSPV